MVKGDQQQPRLVVQNCHVQLISREWQPGYRRVHPVIEQGGAGLVPGQVQGVDVGVRVMAPQVEHGRRDDDVGGVPDGDPAGLRGGTGISRGLGGRAQQRFSAGQEDVPGLGEAGALRGAIQQPGAKLLLKQANLPA